MREEIKAISFALQRRIMASSEACWGMGETMMRCFGAQAQAQRPKGDEAMSSRSSKWKIAGALAVLMTAAGCAGAQTTGQPLKLVQTVSLPGYTGDFDHFAVDRERGRLLLAAEDHATLEVFDLKTGKHLRTVTGFGAPHTILVRPGAKTILVTDSGKSMTKILDAETYKFEGSIPLVEGADSAGYDAGKNVFYIVTGGKDVDMKTAEVEAIDPDTGKKLGAVKFNDDHVEAMVLEENGPRIFVNLTQTNKLAVVDRRTMKELAEWPVPSCEQNAMVKLDEAQKRLYVVCRKPGMVVAMNSDTGAVVSTQPAPLRADEAPYDGAAHRLYVPGGEGYIGVYDTSDPNSVKLIAKVPSAPGAKTGMLLPGMKELVLAASPGETKAVAKVLFYKVE
jgi:DNA-binding beta-propeller fold protein YncE